MGAIVAAIAVGAWFLGRALKKQRSAQMPGGILLVDPPDITFGILPPGETAVSPVAITNRSGRAMGVSRIAVSGIRFGRRFAVEGLPAMPVILEDGARLDFGVRFAPTAPCRCSASLVIETQQPRRRWKVAIAGRATTPTSTEVEHPPALDSDSGSHPRPARRTPPRRPVTAR